MSNSSKKQVLGSPELLRIIFEHSENNRHNALVCRAWCNEALAIIWYSVDDLENLFGLLAPLTHVADEGARGFMRRLRPQDWDRFHRYSWRIQILGDQELSEWTDLGDSLFSEIASTRPHKPLLPNLRVLNYISGPSIFLPMFLSPHLREIHLNYYSPFESEEDVAKENALRSVALYGMPLAMTYLPSCTPQLECLTLTLPENLHLDDYKESTHKILSRAALPKLKTLSLPFVHPTLINDIALLPALEHLDIRDKPRPEFSAKDLAIPAGSFSHLKDLVISGSSALALFSAIQITLPCLVDLEIVHCFSYSQDESEMFFSGLGVSCCRLETLSISLPAFVWSYAPKVSFCRYSALQGLFLCSNLRVLTLDQWMTFDINLNNLLSLLQALPRLTSLRLDNSVRRGASLNLADLSAIIPYCHNLEDLVLCVDARSNVPTITSRAIFPRLRSWHVGKSPAKDHRAIAVYLSGVLPSGCGVGCCRRSDYWDCWEQVDELLPLLIQVRQQERDMA